MELKRQQLSKASKYQYWKKLYLTKQSELFRNKTKLKNDELYIPTKVFQRISDTAADLVMQETPRFVVQTDNEKTLEFIQLLQDNTNLEAVGKPMVREMSFAGCTIVKGLMQDKGGRLVPKFDSVNPEMFYAVFHPDDSTKILEAEIRWFIKVNEKRYIRKEIHKQGQIIQQLFDEQSGEQLDIALFYLNAFGIELNTDVGTGIENMLVRYIPNTKASPSDFEGLSDYEGLEDIVFAVENLLSESNVTTIKNLRPKWSVPASMAQKDRNGNLYLPNSEVYFVNAPMQQTSTGLWVPAQISVEVDMETVKTMYELLIQDLQLASELSPAALSMLKDGMNVDSGKALKFKFYDPLNNAARKRSNLDMAFRDLAYDLMQVAKNLDPYWSDMEVIRPSIEWSDGLPAQWDENANTVMALYANGTGILSQKEALRLQFPHWSEEKINQVIKEKNEERVSDLDSSLFPSFGSGMTNE
ncbi:phage portal protein [Brevibacillus agri]|uniref:phage portal protein n=1 Tax=Brevibacillus agri TaxID=51101 RepID=UPI0025B64050|nr:phage portal protein [Brevibacillus agri]MDN4094356.1 phage portal protein [Brevibacillus agri]